MPGVKLYPFRYRDPQTGKWVKARYKAERVVIAEQHQEWEITGPGETRQSGNTRAFSPFAVQLTAPTPRPLGQRFLELGPHRRKPPRIDARERQLVGVFLRRLIVYEARRGRIDRVRQATDLLVDVTGAN